MRVFWGAAALLFTACMKEPTLVDIRDMDFLAVRDTTLAVQMTALIHNPNALGATLNTANADIKLFGRTIGHGTLAQPAELAAKETSAVKLNADVFLPAMEKLYLKMLKSDSLTLDIQGRFNVRALGVNFNLKRNSKYGFSTKKFVRERFAEHFKAGKTYRIRRVTPKTLPGTQASALTVELELANRFAFDYTLERMDLDVFVGEQRVGTWKSEQPQILKSQSVQSVEFDLTLEHAQLLFSLGGILTGKMPKVHAHGTVALSLAGTKFELPLSVIQ
jgi:LEA14-like dessication related protein